MPVAVENLKILKNGLSMRLLHWHGFQFATRGPKVHNSHAKKATQQVNLVANKLSHVTSQF